MNELYKTKIIGHIFSTNQILFNVVAYRRYYNGNYFSLAYFFSSKQAEKLENSK